METRRPDRLEGIAAWIAAQSIAGRSLLTVTLLALGIACLVGGRLVTLQGGGAAWLVRLLLLEPAGIAALLAACMVIRPRSPLSVYVSVALARRRYLPAAGVIIALGAILEAARWLAREAMLSRLR